jgi:hypothetical protein
MLSAELVSNRQLILEILEEAMNDQQLKIIEYCESL